MVKTLTRACAFNEMFIYLGGGRGLLTPPTPYNAGKRNNKHFDILIIIALAYLSIPEK